MNNSSSMLPSGPSGPAWPVGLSSDLGVPVLGVAAEVCVKGSPTARVGLAADAALGRAGLGAVGAVLLVAALAAAGWLLARWGRRYARWRAMELAMPGPLSVPILGSAHVVLGINEDNSFALTLGAWGGRNTELSRIAILNTLVVFVSDPDHISQVGRSHS